MIVYSHIGILLVVKIIPMILVDCDNGTWSLYKRDKNGWKLVLKGLRAWK